MRGAALDCLLGVSFAGGKAENIIITFKGKPLTSSLLVVSNSFISLMIFFDLMISFGKNCFVLVPSFHYNL